MRLFKLVAPDGDIDWVITNDLAETVTAQVAKDTSDVRWQVEELHRGIKQLTGSEKCQCRAARAQRNHLACCYHAWVSLKVKAKELGQTMYAVRESLFSHYLRAELQQSPHRGLLTTLSVSPGRVAPDDPNRSRVKRRRTYQLSVQGQRQGVRPDCDARHLLFSDFNFYLKECFTYEYNIADLQSRPWWFEIRLEQKLAMEAHQRYPRYIGGVGAPPPETCSGPIAFESLREVFTPEYVAWWIAEMQAAA